MCSRLRDPTPERANSRNLGSTFCAIPLQGGPGQRRRPGDGRADPAEDGRGHDEIPDDQGGAARAGDAAPHDGDDVGDVRPPRAGIKETCGLTFYPGC